MDGCQKTVDVLCKMGRGSLIVGNDFKPYHFRQDVSIGLASFSYTLVFSKSQGESLVQMVMLWVVEPTLRCREMKEPAASQPLRSQY